MDYKTQKAYANIINALFNGSVKANPEQITEELVDMADTMFAEIATCHERIKPLAILADGIGRSVMELMNNEIKLIFGVDNFAQYLKGKTRDEIFKALKQNKLNAALKVLESFYKSWLAYTAKDRRLKVCIVTAQTRWRSKFEIELLGL